MDKATWEAMLKSRSEEKAPAPSEGTTTGRVKTSEPNYNPAPPRNSANKPPTEFEIPELDAALAFINNEGERPSPGQFEPEKPVAKAKKEPKESPRAVEPKPAPKLATMAEINRKAPRVAGGRYEPSEEDTRILSAQYGLSAQFGASRVSFWKDGKRHFVIEAGKVEWKNGPGEGREPVDSLEGLIEYLGRYYGTDVEVLVDRNRPDVGEPSPVESVETVVEIVEPTPIQSVPVRHDDPVSRVDASPVLQHEVPTVIKRIPRLAPGQHGLNPPHPDDFQWDDTDMKMPIIPDQRLIDPLGDKDAEPVPKTPHRILDMGPVYDTITQNVQYQQGIITFRDAREAYVYVIKDMLDNAPTTKRKGKNYKGYKPYAFRILNTDVPYIILPGSNWADTWDWYLDEIFDCIFGEEVIGGRSLRYDKFRRIKYPRASGMHDWGFKMAMGKEGDNLLEWMRRSIKLDPTTRNCVATMWDNGRDLKKRTRREELDVHRKEEYQRIPCPIGIQFTKSEDSKGLDVLLHQRAMDFDGAIASDVYRFAEFAHYAAVGGYPKGYSGSLTIVNGSCILESYGKGDFLYLGNLIEWYTKDPEIWAIPGAYENTRQSSVHLEPNAPTQKAYDWFQAQVTEMGIVYHNWLKCQWATGMERVEKIQYAYYKDMLYASAAFEWMLSECVASEVKYVYQDAPKVQEHLNLPDTLGEYPAFYFMKKVKGFWQYFVAVEAARHFLNMGDYDKLEELFEQTPQTKRFKRYIMVDALIILHARFRKAAKLDPRFTEDILFYEELVESAYKED